MSESAAKGLDEPRDAGQLVVILAVAMPVIFVLLALIVDFGLLAATRARLQAAADAAALAAASQLPANADAALERAGKYTAMNTGPDVESQVSIGDGGRSITIILEQPTRLIFAAMAGIATATPRARASAIVAPTDRMTGARPLGVVQDNFIYGELYTLKEGPGPSSGRLGGNFGALALSGRGANYYRDDLSNGFRGFLRVGDVVETQPGNMGENTPRALADVFAGCYDRWPNISNSCSRLLWIPVIDALPGRGRTTTTVVGFAAFFIENATGPEIVGRFVERVAPGVAGDETTPDYGLYSVRLQR